MSVHLVHASFIFRNHWTSVPLLLVFDPLSTATVWGPPINYPTFQIPIHSFKNLEIVITRFAWLECQ